MFACCCEPPSGQGGVIQELEQEKIVVLLPLSLPQHATYLSHTPVYTPPAYEQTYEPPAPAPAPEPTYEPPAPALAPEPKLEPPAPAKPDIASDEYVFEFTKQGILGLKMGQNSGIVTQVGPDSSIGRAQSNMPRDQQIVPDCVLVGVDGERLPCQKLIQKLNAISDGVKVQLIIKRP